MEYTFEDWLNGIQEPSGLNWIYEKESLKKSSIKDSVFPKHNPVYLEISKAKKFAFDKALEYSIKSMKDRFHEKISTMNLSKRKLYTEKLIEESEKHFIDFDVRQLIDHSPPNKFEGINGEKYLKVKDQYEGLQEGKYILCFIELNKSFLAVLNFELNEFYQDFLKNDCKDLEPEQSEKLQNLQHKLCILDDLGVLDLIEERFKNTNYHGKARETDKAGLIASLFDIDDPERIRQTLKNKDYLSKKQKNNTIKTLENHGLKSNKFTD